MKRSEEIKQLATALAKAQSQMPRLTADAKNPHFNSEYVSMGHLVETIKSTLGVNGLSIIQTIEHNATGDLCLETTLLHSSGEWLSCAMPLLVDRKNMQGVGSAITYARRYTLMSLLCMADSDKDDKDVDPSTRDDDGNRATAAPPVVRPVQTKPAVVKPVAVTPKQEDTPNESRAAELWPRAKMLCGGDAQAREFFVKTTGKQASKDFTPEDWAKIEQALDDMVMKSMESDDDDEFHEVHV